MSKRKINTDSAITIVLFTLFGVTTLAMLIGKWFSCWVTNNTQRSYPIEQSFAEAHFSRQISQGIPVNITNTELSSYNGYRCKKYTFVVGDDDTKQYERKLEVCSRASLRG